MQFIPSVTIELKEYSRLKGIERTAHFAQEGRELVVQFRLLLANRKPIETSLERELLRRIFEYLDNTKDGVDDLKAQNAE